MTELGRTICDAARSDLTLEYQAAVVVWAAGSPPRVVGVYEFPRHNVGGVMESRRRTLTGVGTRMAGTSANSYVVTRTGRRLTVWHGVNSFLHEEIIPESARG